MLRAREGNLSGTGRFTRAQRAHVTAFRSTPMEAVQRVDRMRSRVYNGRFSRSGNVFVGAFLVLKRVRQIQSMSDVAQAMCQNYTDATQVV